MTCPHTHTHTHTHTPQLHTLTLPACEPVRLGPFVPFLLFLSVHSFFSVRFRPSFPSTYRCFAFFPSLLFSFLLFVLNAFLTYLLIYLLPPLLFSFLKRHTLSSVPPDRSSVGKARWTDAEKDYIEEAASALLLENASLYGPKLMSAVLRRIRADKSTRAIFHARHVLDAGRLRSGWRKKRVSHGVPE